MIEPADRTHNRSTLAERQLYLARGVAAVSLIIGVLCSLPLWATKARLYPEAAVWPTSVDHSFVLELTLCAALFGALIAMLVWKSGWWLSAAACAIVVLFVCLDQSRLQPWVVTYSLLLLVSTFSEPCKRWRVSLLATLRFVLAAEYFWGGIQKANVSFVSQVWPSFAQPLLQLLHVPWTVGRAVGVVAPGVEACIGIGLLIPRVRRVAVVGACLVHAMILASLISAGENVSVWAWNLAMPALDIVLFWPSTFERIDVAVLMRFPLSAPILLLVGVLPALSFFGLWDLYASAALYSGNIPQAVVVVDPRALDSLPPLLRRNTWQQSTPMFIDINRWSFEELRVPAYPETRVLKVVGRYVCTRWSRAALYVLILDRPNWLDGHREKERLPCSDQTW